MFTLLKFFLGFILVAFLVALFFIFALVSNVLSLFRKAKPTNTNNADGFGSQGGYSQSSDYSQPNAQPTQKKKIIPQDEGEYVEFEEVN